LNQKKLKKTELQSQFFHNQGMSSLQFTNFEKKRELLKTGSNWFVTGSNPYNCDANV